MALGKAFIEVHADTKPFARELGTELSKIIDAAEKDVKASSRKVGSTISKETSKGIDKDKDKVKKSFSNMFADLLTSEGFSKFAKGIVDTLDDGLSGLPAELKFILGAALVAALPVALALGSALASAIVAGLTVIGGAGIGALIALQFEEVKASATSTMQFLRDTFSELGQPLVRPFLNAIALIRSRLVALSPDISRLFNSIALTIVPVADALLGFVEEFLPLFRAAFANIGKYLAPLQIALRDIGQAAGNFFQVILENENAPAAFYDMLILVRDLTYALTGLIYVGLELYGVFRDIAEAIGLVPEYGEEIRMIGKELGIASQEQSIFGAEVKGTLAPLEAQNQEIEDYNKNLKDLVTAQFAVIRNQIDYRQGIDDLSESLKKNKDTLDLHKQAGRDNALVLLDLAQTIRQTRDDTIALTGDVAGAERTFASQRAEVYRVAKQFGLSRVEVDKLIKSILELPAPKQTGVTGGSLTRLESFNQALKETIYLQSLINPNYNPQGPGGQQRYADGGIVNQPTNALIGEAGPEVVIPLSKPDRAAELVSQSGLGQMMSPNVNVYIGNQQLDAYIAVTTNQYMAQAARAMSYGTRGI